MKPKKFLYFITIIIIYILFFTNAKIISFTIKNTINFCIDSVITTLFPIMVISNFLTQIFSTGKIDLPEYISNFGICRKYFIPILFGTISGFVTGAKNVCKIYDKNCDDPVSFSNAIILSSNAGVGLVISYVGIILCKNIIVGLIIYLMQILICLILGRFVLGKAKDFNNNDMNNNYKSIVSCFTDSITSSAFSVINICSFTLFFSTIISLLLNYLPDNINLIYTSIITIFLEFSQGIFICMQLSNISLSGFFIGFSIGFGGICVMLQIFSVCDRYPLNKKMYFIFKLLHGILLGLTTSLIFILFDVSPFRATFVYSNKKIFKYFFIGLVILFLLKIKTRICKKLL